MFVSFCKADVKNALIICQNQLCNQLHITNLPHLKLLPPAQRGPAAHSCCEVCPGDPPGKKRPAPCLRTGSTPAEPDR